MAAVVLRSFGRESRDDPQRRNASPVWPVVGWPYVLAIAGGFLPLVASYSGHGVALAVVEVTRGAGAHDHHHLGDADDAAHHHVLQDLTGTFTWAPEGDHAPIVHVAMMPAAAPPLIAADVVRLERPPKSLLSI